MKPLTLMLAAAAMLVALPARADTIPAIYFGQWCGAEPDAVDLNLGDTFTFYPRNGLADWPANPNRKPDCAAGEYITIDKHGMKAGSRTCRWTRIRRTGDNGARSTKPRPRLWPKGDLVPTIIVRADCVGGWVDGWGPGYERRFRFEWLKGDNISISWRGLGP